MINMDFKDFFGTYQASNELCDKILNYYNQNKHLVSSGKILEDGESGVSKVVNKDFKDSNDLSINSNNYHYPMNEYREYLQDCLLKYANLYEDVHNHSKFNIIENYNIQHYNIGGGFKKWHFESSSPVDKSRVLVFMTYLNDVDDGGTEFKYQNITIPAKKGLTLIWPSGFTHTHRGQISYTKEKYIITGWWSLLNE